MPSVHRNPVKNFRPPPELYGRAKAAAGDIGHDMNSYLVDCLRRLAGDREAESVTAEWAVQAGQGDQWRLATDWYPERSQAVERLDWFRSNSAASVSHRLARKTTTIVVDIEEQPPTSST